MNTTTAVTKAGRSGLLLEEYYRTPETWIRYTVSCPQSDAKGFFQFGDGTICYGSCAHEHLADGLDKELPDVSSAVRINGSGVELPFDPELVVDNLRFERYCSPERRSKAALKNAYYWVRPHLPQSVRRQLQKLYLMRGLDSKFPAWPVDYTVERILDKLFYSCLLSSNRTQVPFIWFWPKGFRTCVIMTHDVETQTGLDFLDRLMDINSEHGLSASFQFVPEQRYHVGQSRLKEIRERGFEVNLHGLNHDGSLFASKSEFLQRAQKINCYAQQFEAVGFRSPVLYRNQHWLNELRIAYDMSVPNVGHMDPQPGGCCTVRPYFNNSLIELPLTTIQDYSLLHYLNDYSTSLWERQMDILFDQSGLISFNIHPDYIIEERAHRVYRRLLEHIEVFRQDRPVWAPLPREVANWWMNRSRMRLIPEGEGNWRISGPESHQACLAFASVSNGELVFEVEQ